MLSAIVPVLLAHIDGEVQKMEGWMVNVLAERLRKQSERRSLSGHTRSLLIEAADSIENSTDVSDDFFGAVLNCAVRYSLGRQSYMPSLVIDFITPLIPRLSDKTLWCFAKDIAEQKRLGYGDPMIDEPMWMRFLGAVREEQERRAEGNKKEASYYDCSE